MATVASDRSEDEPRVLAVVPTLDARSGRLARLVRSLERLECREGVELVVVVNTVSRSGVLPTATSWPDTPLRVTRIETGLNLGFAGSVVLAAGLHPGLHVWALQDDTVLEPGCLTVLLAELDGDPALGAVSPTVVDADGLVPRRTSGGRLDDAGHITEFLPPTDVHPDDLRTDDADFLMSRGMLVRRRAWDDVGGMDPRMYPVSWTDVDLCYRLRQVGWTFTASTAARLMHTKGASTPSVLSSVTYRRNGERFRVKRAGRAAPLPVHPAIPHELLAAVAQESSALTFDLVDRIDLPFAFRLALRPLRRRVERLSRRLRHGA